MTNNDELASSTAALGDESQEAKECRVNSFQDLIRPLTANPTRFIYYLRAQGQAGKHEATPLPELLTSFLASSFALLGKATVTLSRHVEPEWRGFGRRNKYADKPGTITHHITVWPEGGECLDYKLPPWITLLLERPRPEQGSPRAEELAQSAYDETRESYLYYALRTEHGGVEPSPKLERLLNLLAHQTRAKQDEVAHAALLSASDEYLEEEAERRLQERNKIRLVAPGRRQHLEVEECLYMAGRCHEEYDAQRPELIWTIEECAKRVPLGMRALQSVRAKRSHECMRGCVIFPGEVYFKQSALTGWGGDDYKYCATCVAIMLYAFGVYMVRPAYHVGYDLTEGAPVYAGQDSLRGDMSRLMAGVHSRMASLIDPLENLQERAVGQQTTSDPLETGRIPSTQPQAAREGEEFLLYQRYSPDAKFRLIGSNSNCEALEADAKERHERYKETIPNCELVLLGRRLKGSSTPRKFLKAAEVEKYGREYWRSPSQADVD